VTERIDRSRILDATRAAFLNEDRACVLNDKQQRASRPKHWQKNPA